MKDNKIDIQEEQYDFPYHYLTSNAKENFSLSRFLQWGLVHASYNELLAELLVKMGPQKILDAGCGDGRFLYELEKTLPQSALSGIDISERALHFARGFNKQARFFVHDIIKNPLKELHDLCVSIEVIEHIPPEDIPSYVNNISKSLKPNGTLIITTPTTNLPLNKKHYQHFTEESLSKILESDFNIKDVRFLNHETRGSDFLSRLLANKFFIINHQGIKNAIYRYYRNNYLHSTKLNGSRILIVATKK